VIATGVVRMSLEAAAAEAVPQGVAPLRAALGQEARGLDVALARLDWVAALRNAAAPGFVYLAGACGGLAVGGGGRDLREAAGKLAGEASEILAQRRAPAPEDLPVDPAIGAVWGDGPAVAVASLATGRRIGAPLSAIFRDRPGAPEAPPRSLGCGAGPTPEAARLAGLLELVERDAAAAWWAGAARPRAPAAEAAAGPSALLAALRAGAAASRPTFLLLLPAVAGLPVAAAVSRDGDAGGGGLVVGLKAALDPETALIGAILELLQMEIGLEIVRMRAAQGRPTAEDAATLARAALEPDAFAAFAALPPRAEAAPAVGGLDALVARLGAAGVEPFAFDLPSAPGGLAAAKIFAPGLLPLPGPGPAPRADAPGARAGLI
jgi:ribosomal protein S12 methylthiotransferase accessory factor